MRTWKYGILAGVMAAPSFGQTAEIDAALEKARAAAATLAPLHPEMQAQLKNLRELEGKLGQFEAGEFAEHMMLAQNAVEKARTDMFQIKNNMAFDYQVKVDVERAMRDRSSASYDSATRALDNHRYEDAIRGFDAVINSKGQKADGALYWKAYALDKAGRRDEALAAVAKLRQEYPQSRWLGDAQVLEGAVRQGAGQPAGAADSNEELKLMAINSLMSGDPERAVPLLEGLLKGNSSPKLKERALFVLTQSKTPRAAAMLSEYAKGAGNPDLQARAIRYLGMSGTADAQQQLMTVYTGSSDAGTKREVIRALAFSKSVDPLFSLLKSEKDAELRLEAIRLLGPMRATSQLTQLLSTETATDNRVSIVRGLLVAGAHDKLLELAKTEKDPKVRAEAIRALVTSGGATSDAVQQIYAADSDPKIRQELVNGLAARGDAKALVELARKESDPAMKRMIVERLSHSRAKEATDYMLELLK